MSKTQSERQCPTDIAFTAAGGRPVPLRCGSWNCQSCARFNAHQWARVARFGVAHLDNQAYFWTLTLSGAIRSQQRAYELLPKLWDTLRKKIQRHAGAWLYIAFVEGQPRRGYMPHFHILTPVKAWERLKDIAVASGFGYQAKESLIDSDGASDYVAKYASKQGWHAPPNFRRVRCSRSWPKPPDPEMEQYLVRANTETLYGFLDRVARKTYRDTGELYEDYMLCMGRPIDTEDWQTTNSILPAPDTDD